MMPDKLNENEAIKTHVMAHLRIFAANRLPELVIPYAPPAELAGNEGALDAYRKKRVGQISVLRAKSVAYAADGVLPEGTKETPATKKIIEAIGALEARITALPAEQVQDWSHVAYATMHAWIAELAEQGVIQLKEPNIAQEAYRLAQWSIKGMPAKTLNDHHPESTNSGLLVAETRKKLSEMAAEIVREQVIATNPKATENGTLQQQALDQSMKHAAEMVAQATHVKSDLDLRALTIHAITQHCDAYATLLDELNYARTMQVSGNFYEESCLRDVMNEMHRTSRKEHSSEAYKALHRKERELQDELGKVKAADQEPTPAPVDFISLQQAIRDAGLSLDDGRSLSEVLQAQRRVAPRAAGMGGLGAS